MNVNYIIFKKSDQFSREKVASLCLKCAIVYLFVLKVKTCKNIYIQRFYQETSRK